MNKELNEMENENNPDMNPVTREEFESYVDVQESGVTNMFDVRTVESLSGLSKGTIVSIMKSYGELKDKYDE
jgi:hypothetical protein